MSKALDASDLFEYRGYHSPGRPLRLMASVVLQSVVSAYNLAGRCLANLYCTCLGGNSLPCRGWPMVEPRGLRQAAVWLIGLAADAFRAFASGRERATPGEPLDSTLVRGVVNPELTDSLAFGLWSC